MCSAVGRSEYQKEQKEVPKEQRRLLYSRNGRGREGKGNEARGLENP